MKVTSRVFLVAFFGLVAVICLMVGTLATGSTRSRQVQSDLVEQVAATIRCPVCDGLSVADSSAPIAKDIRGKILQDVHRHMTESQIENSFVAQYGRSILLRPQRSGLSALVWLLPLVAISIGILILAAFYYDRAKNPPWKLPRGDLK